MFLLIRIVGSTEALSRGPKGEAGGPAPPAQGTDSLQRSVNIYLLGKASRPEFAGCPAVCSMGALQPGAVHAGAQHHDTWLSCCAEWLQLCSVEAQACSGEAQPMPYLELSKKCNRVRRLGRGRREGWGFTHNLCKAGCGSFFCLNMEGQKRCHCWHLPG